MAGMSEVFRKVYENRNNHKNKVPTEDLKAVIAAEINPLTSYDDTESLDYKEIHDDNSLSMKINGEKPKKQIENYIENPQEISN